MYGNFLWQNVLKPFKDKNILKLFMAKCSKTILGQNVDVRGTRRRRESTVRREMSTTQKRPKNVRMEPQSWSGNKNWQIHGRSSDDQRKSKLFLKFETNWKSCIKYDSFGKFTLETPSVKCHTTVGAA